MLESKEKSEREREKQKSQKNEVKMMKDNLIQKRFVFMLMKH